MTKDPSQANTPRGPAAGGGGVVAGLPIFENKQYKKNLNKLLCSKDLDECYDYESNDQSYKKLYQCLTHNKQFSSTKKLNDQNTPNVSFATLNNAIGQSFNQQNFSSVNSGTASFAALPNAVSTRTVGLNIPPRLNQDSTVRGSLNPRLDPLISKASSSIDQFDQHRGPERMTPINQGAQAGTATNPHVHSRNNIASGDFTDMVNNKPTMLINEPSQESLGSDADTGGGGPTNHQYTPASKFPRHQQQYSPHPHTHRQSNVDAGLQPAEARYVLADPRNYKGHICKVSDIIRQNIMKRNLGTTFSQNKSNQISQFDAGDGKHSLADIEQAMQINENERLCAQHQVNNRGNLSARASFFRGSNRGEPTAGSQQTGQFSARQSMRQPAAETDAFNQSSLFSSVPAVQNKKTPMDQIKANRSFEQAGTEQSTMKTRNISFMPNQNQRYVTPHKLKTSSRQSDAHNILRCTQDQKYSNLSSNMKQNNDSMKSKVQSQSQHQRNQKLEEVEVITESNEYESDSADGTNGFELGDNQRLGSPSYEQLNNKLMFPNNPAYFLIKKLSSSMAEAQKEKNDQVKPQTLLEYCREQGIAFTDTDKVMYNLNTSKKLHYLLKKFLEKDTKLLEEEYGDQSDQNKDANEDISQISVQAKRYPSKYQGGEYLAFDNYGDINKNLSEAEMIKFFTDVLENKLAVPEKKPRPKKLQAKNLKQLGPKEGDPLPTTPTFMETGGDLYREASAATSNRFTTIQSQGTMNATTESDCSDQSPRRRHSPNNKDAALNSQRVQQSVSNGLSNNGDANLSLDSPESKYSKNQKTQKKLISPNHFKTKKTSVGIQRLPSKVSRQSPQFPKAVAAEAAEESYGLRRQPTMDAWNRSKQAQMNKEMNKQQRINKQVTLSKKFSSDFKPKSILNRSLSFKGGKEQSIERQIDEFLRSNTLDMAFQNSLGAVQKRLRMHKMKTMPINSHDIQNLIRKNSIVVSPKALKPGARSSENAFGRFGRHNSVAGGHAYVAHGQSAMPISLGARGTSWAQISQLLQNHHSLNSNRNKFTANFRQTLTKQPNGQNGDSQSLDSWEKPENELWKTYVQKNTTFRRGLQRLEDSINDAHEREAYIKECELRDHEERKQQKLRKTNSKKSFDSYDSQNEVSDTASAKAKFEEKKRKADPTYGMLDSCVNMYKNKHKLTDDTNKLMQRMELDRPILQREKFELLFLEKINEYPENFQELENQSCTRQSREKFEKQATQFVNSTFVTQDQQPAQQSTFCPSPTSRLSKTKTLNPSLMQTPMGKSAKLMQIDSIEGGGDHDVTTPGPAATIQPKAKRMNNIRIHEIQKAKHNRMKQRKLDNQAQLQAYKKMCIFIRNRFQEERVRPVKDELKLLEVLKKIVESGWIITAVELKQVVEFLQIKNYMIQGSVNLAYRTFIERILTELNIKADIDDIISD